MVFFKDSTSIVQERNIYTLIDLLGDLGGVVQILFLIFNIFLSPISEHSFIMKATKRLFTARTTNEDLFDK